MKNFQQSGASMLVIAAAAVLSGSVVKVGSLLGVAAHDAAAGEELQVNLRGVYLVPKVAAAAIVQGEPITYVVATGLVTNSAATPATGDVSGAAGVAFEAAGAGSSHVAVLFTGVPGTVKA